MDWTKAPEEVRKIRDEVMAMEIKPVESYASIHFQRHGKEFHRQYIRSILREVLDKRIR